MKLTIDITIEAQTKMQAATLIGMFVKQLMGSNDIHKMTAPIRREYGVLRVKIDEPDHE